MLFKADPLTIEGEDKLTTIRKENEIMAIEKTSGAVVYRVQDGQLEYLLLQSTNRGNFWGFPKGHVEGAEDLITTATQAQRDHEIIHTRNFRVQPQAIMGSGIVD